MLQSQISACFSRLWALCIGLMLCLSSLSCNKEAAEVPRHDLSPGASAAAFVAGSPFGQLRLEILFMPGHAPTESSLQQLQSFLQQHLQKPGGITISTKAIASGGKNNYTVDDLRGIETAHRSQFNRTGSMSMCLILVDGDFAVSNQVLGVAYNNTSMALFHRTIQQNSGGLTQPSRATLETTVMQHEVGHLLGLVNIGAPMAQAHEDNNHRGHCNNRNCLMYYAVETTAVLGSLLGGNIPELDAACVNDLNALRSGN